MFECVHSDCIFPLFNDRKRTTQLSMRNLSAKRFNQIRVQTTLKSSITHIHTLSRNTYVHNLSPHITLDNEYLFTIINNICVDKYYNIRIHTHHIYNIYVYICMYIYK